MVQAMPIKYSQGLLDLCGISQPELEERIRLLETCFGRPSMDTIFNRYNGLDVALVKTICECSVIVEALSSTSGFDTIRRKIIRGHPQYLGHPPGEWLQLKVGYILKTIEEQPIFEQKINGIPKDIFLRNETIHIECKSFGGGKEFEKVVNQFMKTGKVPEIKTEYPKGFNRTYILISSVDNLLGKPLFPPFEVNEFPRFLSNGVEKKYRQLLDGVCNIIAFNSSYFGNDHGIRYPILDLLQSGNYPLISGFLVIDSAMNLSDNLLGSVCSTDLIENPFADVKIPQDLSHALKQQIRIALRT
jgi:hypothetical protein